MILQNLTDKKIVLASKSPRRQMLLKGLELEFEIRTKEIKEVYPDHLVREEVALFLSELKANAFKEELKADELLITSDTIVYLDNQVIEKPADRNEAIGMITRLSGNEHTVITAVTITTHNRQESFYDETKVKFVSLSKEEIEYYVDKYQPFDKAGAYGVQELIGYIGIEGMDGSYYNVMGLPLQKLYATLKTF